MSAIGVVAGVGPYAGLDLLRKIAEQTRSATDQEHLAVFSISDPGPIPDRTSFLLGEVDVNPAVAIAEQLRMLHQMGATVAGIPCNTAHASSIFDLIRQRLPDDLRLLHMIEETASWIRRHHPYLRKIGILATSGTIKAGIYASCLSSAGLQTVLPDRPVQDQYVQPAIYNRVYGIKATGGGSTEAREALLFSIEHLRRNGAEAIILGCTEIPLAIPEASLSGTPTVDPTLVLARALIRAIDPQKLKPRV